MRSKLKFSIFSLIILFALSLGAKQTKVSIVGDMFYINGEPTYKGVYYNKKKIEGLLMNSRMVNGVFDDENPKTRNTFIYDDTKQWDANRNTEEFVLAMSDWRSCGLLAFTLCLQGGSPVGYGNKNWINTAFDAEGNFKEAYKERTKKILDEADRLGMIVILSCFYFGQDQHLKDENAVINAVKNTANWLLDEGYENVIMEIANESDHKTYDHDIIKAENNHKLIKIAKSITKDGKRLLVSTSLMGDRVPTEEIVAEADFVLLHANSIKNPDKLKILIDKTRALKTYTKKPVLVNEDDHYDYHKPKSNLSVSIDEYVSWGFFDYRRKGESFDEGYQSIPANWKISSQRKKDFFNKIKEITTGN